MTLSSLFIFINHINCVWVKCVYISSQSRGVRRLLLTEWIYLILFIAKEVGCEETRNFQWKKGLLYNLQSVSRVTQQHYDPLFPKWFRRLKTRLMTSLSHPIVFYGRWQAGCRERIKQSPLSQSLSYQNTAGWEPEARKSNITTSPMSHSLVPCSLLLRASTHTMNTYVKTQHTNTHSHNCNNLTEIEPLGLHTDDCLLGRREQTDAALQSNVRLDQIQEGSSKQQKIFWHFDFDFYSPRTSSESSRIFFPTLDKHKRVDVK